MNKILIAVLLLFAFSTPVKAQEQSSFFHIPLLQSGEGEYTVTIESSTVVFTGFFTFGVAIEFKDSCTGTRSRITCTFTPAKLSQMLVYYQSRDLPCYADSIYVQINGQEKQRISVSKVLSQCVYLPGIMHGGI